MSGWGSALTLPIHMLPAVAGTTSPLMRHRTRFVSLIKRVARQLGYGTESVRFLVD